MRTLFRTSIVALALVVGSAFAAEARDWGSRSQRDCERPSYQRGGYGGGTWYGPPGRSPYGPPGHRKWSSYDHRRFDSYDRHDRRVPHSGRLSRWNDRYDYRRPERDRVVILERRAPGYSSYYRRYPRGW